MESAVGDMDAAEEDAIQALLAGIQPQQEPQPPGVAAPSVTDRAPSADERKAMVDAARDRLVFDAACGQDSWSTQVARQEVDFVEQRPNGWAASVSVVLSLLSTDGGHMHDEVGSGHVDGAEDSNAAQQHAFAKAIASASKRLAKRFASALGQAKLGAIETAAWREATGHAPPPPQHWQHRGRGRGRGRARG